MKQIKQITIFLSLLVIIAGSFSCLEAEKVTLRVRYYADLFYNPKNAEELQEKDQDMSVKMLGGYEEFSSDAFSSSKKIEDVVAPLTYETLETLEIDNPQSKSLNELKALLKEHLAKKGGLPVSVGGMICDYELPEQQAKKGDTRFEAWKNIDPDKPIGNSINLNEPITIQYLGYCHSRQLAIVTPDDNKLHVAFMPQIQLKDGTVLRTGEPFSRIVKRIQFTIKNEWANRYTVDQIFRLNASDKEISWKEWTQDTWSKSLELIDSWWSWEADFSLKARSTIKNPDDLFQDKLKGSVEYGLLTQNGAQKDLYRMVYGILSLMNKSRTLNQKAIIDVLGFGFKQMVRGGVQAPDYLCSYDRNNVLPSINDLLRKCIENASKKLASMKPAERYMVIEKFIKDSPKNWADSQDFYQDIKKMADRDLLVAARSVYLVQKYVGILPEYQEAHKQAIAYIKEKAKNENILNRLPNFEQEPPNLLPPLSKEEREEIEGKQSLPPQPSPKSHTSQWVRYASWTAIAAFAGVAAYQISKTEKAQRLLYERTSRFRKKLPTSQKVLKAEIKALEECKKDQSFDDEEFKENAWKILRQYNDTARETLEQEAFGEVMNIMPARLLTK